MIAIIGGRVYTHVHMCTHTHRRTHHMWVCIENYWFFGNWKASLQLGYHDKNIDPKETVSQLMYKWVCYSLCLSDISYISTNDLIFAGISVILCNRVPKTTIHAKKIRSLFFKIFKQKAVLRVYFASICQNE